MRALLRRRAALLGVAVGVPLSVTFLWLAVRSADFDAVWSALAGAEMRFVVLAVVAIAGVYLGQAARWRAIARTPTVSTARFGEWVVSGVAVNNVLPGRIGDLLRARWLQVAVALAFAILMQAVWYIRTLLVGGTLLARRAVERMRHSARVGPPWHTRPEVERDQPEPVLRTT